MKKEDFKSLVMPVKDKAFRLALSLLGNRAEAEDMVQNLYLKLWNMRLELTEYDSVEALAMTMMKNLCIDELRSYRHRNVNDEAFEQYKMSAGDQYNPGRNMEINESLGQVRKIIRQLPERQRLILHLRDIEQYSYDEIETMTEMSRNNIRVTLSRARRRVHREFQKIQDYDYGKN